MSTGRKRLIHTLCHMKDRCFNKNCNSYPDYGGRGITVCDEWVNNADSFVEWAMSHGYADDLAIDRIDNDGNYCPENCRWVTARENNQNRRSSKLYTIDGVTKNLQQWCDFYGIRRCVVDSRLKRGWDILDALTRPKISYDYEALVGKKFGMLTVSKFLGKEKNKPPMYECLCDCGNTAVVRGDKLSGGITKSCGCIRRYYYDHQSAYKNGDYTYADVANHSKSK